MGRWEVGELMDKLEEYLLSEKALDCQFILFIALTISLVINMLFLNYSMFGAYIVLLIFSIMTLDVALTVFVILYISIKNKKGE